MSLNAPRVRIPRSARAGEVIEVRTLIEHAMETGIRVDGARPPPRDLLDRMQVTLNGAPLLEASLRNGTSANPYHVFFVRIERTSELVFTWSDERGRLVQATHRVAVS